MGVLRDFLVNFLANLGGALFGVLLAFWLERRRKDREETQLYGRVLRSCRFELGYLRSYAQSDVTALKNKRLPGTLLSAGIAATRGALVNPLVHEHAPRPLITVLNAVSALLEADAGAAKELHSIWPKLQQSDAGREQVQRIQTELAELLTRLERMVGLALETLDAELRRLGLAVEPDPADYAMGQTLRRILTEPVEEPTADAK